ncbi:O-antigen translocase [Bacillus sp. 1P02SD]|uniref:O-antigen translocase n=1 Tax=Bacillus sp. 1P02SD TaxID=3132264 RepID=UPI0039A210E2
MNFLKTSILTGISTIIKILSGLVINKVISVYIGPAGIALIGQFQSVLNIVTTLGNGAINSGVTKYVAEYNEDKAKRDEVISAGLIITITFSVIIGAIIFLFSRFFSIEFLQSENYHLIFKTLGITLILTSLNTFLLSLLNGLKKIKLFIFVNITSSVISLIITSILTIKYLLFGALLSSILIQAIVLCVSLPSVIKLHDFNFTFHRIVNHKVYKSLFAFSLMAIVTVLTVPVVQIAIRSHLINQFSIEQAGYWQSVWKISEMYLMVLTTAFSTYYLPRLSELQTRLELRKEIFSGYKIIIPFVLISTLAIYFLRDFIIWLLFTPDFLEMRSLFLFQLIGDFLKMCSWTLSFLMLAKAMTKTFIITEVVFSASFYLLTVYFTKLFGLIGVTIAYATNYFVYLIVIIFIFSDIVFNRDKNKQLI